MTTYTSTEAERTLGTIIRDLTADLSLLLRSEIALERHEFAQVVEYSEGLTKLMPEDTWNWGTLGDALMERGEYERASTTIANAYVLPRMGRYLGQLEADLRSAGIPGPLLLMMSSPSPPYSSVVALL